MEHPAVETLADLVARPEGSWALAEGALAIARIGTPDLGAASCMARLDELGQRAREAIGRAAHPRFAAAGIARVLCQEENFVPALAGNLIPEHAYLDKILDRRVAIPTALALVFIEVGRRAGLRFEGIGMPGRFILAHRSGEMMHYFDPSDHGRPLDLDDCRQLVASYTAGAVEFRDGFLRPITPTQILARIVGYLKATFWQMGDHGQALLAVHLLLTIRPDDPREIRDRGRILYLMERYREAIRELETYLAHNPRAEDSDAVRRLLEDARAGLR